MTCDDLRTQLPLLLTNDVPDAEPLQQHLQTCANCQQAWVELQQVQKLLNTPAPAEIAPVDVNAIYYAALERQPRPDLFWKRTAIAAIGIAASLLVFALIPKLEIKADANEFTIRWGPPAPAPTPIVLGPVRYSEPDPADAVNARLTELAAKQDRELKTLKELLLTLATDVEERDTKQRDQLAAVLRSFRQFERLTQQQFAESDKTQRGLYTAIFHRSEPKE